MTTLDRLSQGQKARVETVSGTPGVVQRLYEMGLLEGDEVEVVRFAPLGDPIEIRVANTHLSLRRVEAAGVRVTPV
jgi:ferrous iron transport protein A